MPPGRSPGASPRRSTPASTRSPSPPIGSTPEEARDLANAVVDAVVVVALQIVTGGRTRGASHAIVPLEEAQLPGRALHARLPRAAMKGAVGGLGLAYALLIARRLIDRRVRVGQAPRGGHRCRRSSGSSPRRTRSVAPHRGVRGDLGRAAEAFRQLRTNLRFVDVDNDPAQHRGDQRPAGEGKSTVVVQPRRALVAAGRAAGAADRRRPAATDDRHHLRDRRRGRPDPGARRRRRGRATSSQRPGLPNLQPAAGGPDPAQPERAARLAGGCSSSSTSSPRTTS